MIVFVFVLFPFRLDQLSLVRLTLRSCVRSLVCSYASSLVSELARQLVRPFVRLFVIQSVRASRLCDDPCRSFVWLVRYVVGSFVSSLVPFVRPLV